MLPSATGALVAIAKCQHYEKGIASYSASITQHVKTANLWLKSDWNRTVWWNDRESRNCKEEKLRPSFEMPNNANKQGRNFSPYFCCEVIKHFSIKISFGAPWRHWRWLALGVIVLANTLFVQTIHAVTIQSVVHALGECASATRHICAFFTLNTVLEVTVWRGKEGEQV